LFTTQRVYIEDQTAVWSTVEHCQSVKQLAPLQCAAAAAAAAAAAGGGAPRLSNSIRLIV